MAARTRRRNQSLAVAHLRLANWRNFTSVDIPLQRRVFIVGPNASGKSNLLDALRFLRDVVAVGGGFQEAVRRRGGVSRIRCLAARRYPDVAITVDISGEPDQPSWQYELRFKQDNRQRPLVERETVRKDGRILLTRPDDKDRSDPERLSQTYLEQVNANQEFRDVSDFFASLRYLHIVPQLVREPDRFVGKSDDPYGSDFIETIARTPEKTRAAWLNRIRSALQLAVPQLTELEMTRDVRGVPHLRGKYEHWRARGAWQSESDFSDGTLRLMGLLWALLEGGGPLMLEEPEIHLHEGVVRHIPQMINSMQRRSGRQVFISTHSRELLDDPGIGVDEVLLLRPTTEGTVVSSASDIREIADLLGGGVPMGEAVLPLTVPPRASQLQLFGS